MTNDPKPTTYFQQAVAEPPLGGRWAGKRPHVNGSEPTVPVAAAPNWHQGPQPGPEPPLGWSVDEVPDLGMGRDRRP
jgi:hypothetical protein